MAPNTMTRPCSVVIWLKKAGSTNCIPGWNSSARMTMAKKPPRSRNIAFTEVHDAIALHGEGIAELQSYIGTRPSLNAFTMAAASECTSSFS